MGTKNLAPPRKATLRQAQGKTRRNKCMKIKLNGKEVKNPIIRSLVAIMAIFAVYLIIMPIVYMVILPIGLLLMFLGLLKKK